MKRIIFFIGLIVAGCSSEKGVEIAKPATFVRYFNSGTNDEAKLIKQTPDNGFIILSNGKKDNPYGAKVIKTDVYGNQEWQQLFFKDKVDSLRDLLILPTGYLLLGSSNIYTLDINGDTTKTGTAAIKYPKVDNQNAIFGASVALNNNANYLVTCLSATTNNGISTMYLGELDKVTYKWNWIKPIGFSKSIVNKLYVDSKNLVYWATPDVKITNRVRVIQTPQNSNQANSGSTLGTPTVNQTPFDLSRYGNGFALTGITDEKGDNDIFYYLLSENFSLLGDSKIIDLTTSEATSTSIKGGGQVTFKMPGKQTGYSISSTQEGGLIVLGSVDASNIPDYSKNSNKTEYMLIKVDGFGNLATGWPKYYGSKEDDFGASIIQANDGSFVLLGTTNLGGTKTLMLMKTDKDGNIQ